MYELGKKSEVEGIKVADLTPLPHDKWWPTKMPSFEGNEVVICGFDQGLGEKLFVCESIEDMQHLYDKFMAGWALDISWYRGRIVEIKIYDIDFDNSIAAGIIKHIAGSAPKEVKEALAAYAMGNPGAATVLAERAKDFKTAAQVEELIGWPLADHSEERTEEIWDRFRP